MKRILHLIASPSARSTGIYYFGNFFLSVGRYFFHLALLRFLSPGEYGEFLSYLSLTYLLGIPMSTLGNIVTKYVAEFYGRGEKTSINHFFYYLLLKAAPITLSLGALLIVFSGLLASIFKAHSIAFVVLGFSIFFSLFQTVLSSYLAAFQKFVSQTLLGYLNIFLSISFAIVLINFGLGATGAVLGQLLSTIVITFITFLILKSSLIPKHSKTTIANFDIKSFAGFSLLYAIGTTSLISTDILLVRSLFDPTTSGLYSSLSILGRMILFGLTPLSSIALPIATHRFAKTGSARSILLKLGGAMLFFGSIGVSLFSLFPTMAIQILSGTQYLAAAPFLGIFALSMLLFALSQFLLSYLMATSRPSANYFLIIAAVLQPVLLVLLPHTLSVAVLIGLGVESLLFASLSIFLVLQKKTKLS